MQSNCNSDGTSAVEAALRASPWQFQNKHEFISAYRDFHGKSMGAVSCAQMYRGETHSYGPTRAPGFYMVPRPDPYRPLWTKADGTIDTDAYIKFYEEFFKEGTVGNILLLFSNLHKVGPVVFSLLMISFQNWKKLCEKYSILLYDDWRYLPAWDVPETG